MGDIKEIKIYCNYKKFTILNKSFLILLLLFYETKNKITTLRNANWESITHPFYTDSYYQYVASCVSICWRILGWKIMTWGSCYGNGCRDDYLFNYFTWKLTQYCGVYFNCPIFWCQKWKNGQSYCGTNSSYDTPHF